jgi:geranylgeranyl pyrophosphate synthase
MLNACFPLNHQRANTESVMTSRPLPASLVASALDSLVQGEILQIKSEPNDVLEMSYYLRKSYYKTASLICYACKVTINLQRRNPCLTV